MSKQETERCACLFIHLKINVLIQGEKLQPVTFEKKKKGKKPPTTLQEGIESKTIELVCIQEGILCVRSDKTHAIFGLTPSMDPRACIDEISTQQSIWRIQIDFYHQLRQQYREAKPWSIMTSTYHQHPWLIAEGFSPC